MVEIRDKCSNNPKNLNLGQFFGESFRGEKAADETEDQEYTPGTVVNFNRDLFLGG